MQVKDLKKQYEVIRIDETTGEEYLVWNAKNKYKRYHTNLADANYTIIDDSAKWRTNKPKFRWIIRWRWVSKWEILK